MVLDTSAMVAILRDEPEAARFRQLVAGAAQNLMSSISALEATCVLEGRHGEQAGAEFELLAYKIPIRIVAFDADQLEIARNAWRSFGKGRHPAGLNFGDCAAYALAKSAGEPLLFKGNDFRQTDIGQADPG
jgi:ribonuclease VapC